MVNRMFRATVLVASVGVTLIPAARASAADSGSSPTTQVVGGHPVSNPSVVQLDFTQSGGEANCTGELISSEWVLTARHCTQGNSSMNVYFSNSTSNRGTPIAADKLLNSSSGDFGLVHLSEEAPVKQYLTVADSYTAKSGDSGEIEGYGLAADGQPVSSLRGADVTVIGRSEDATYGDAIHIRGNDGASNHGDSGGPLLIDDQVVGVCSTGDTADPGSNTHATSNYANVTNSRSWIRQNAGV